MRKLNRLARLEVAMKAVQEQRLAKCQAFADAIADYEARRKSGAPISEEEQERFARAYEILDIARARRDKALGIRRKPPKNETNTNTPAAP
jgi:uncharacterized protein (DUF2384 family)